MDTLIRELLISFQPKTELCDELIQKLNFELKSKIQNLYIFLGSNKLLKLNCGGREGPNFANKTKTHKIEFQTSSVGIKNNYK